MRKLFLILMFIPVVAFGQLYEIVDSLPLERINIYSPFDYKGDEIIDMGDGDYLIELPHKDKMIIMTDKERTKAIIVYNSVVFGRHKEFNIQENARRIVFWYQDDNLFCGYIYDKYYKVARYFEESSFKRFRPY